MERMTEAQLNEAINNFEYEGELLSWQPYGIGHINDTYLLVFRIGKMGTLTARLQ